MYFHDENIIIVITLKFVSKGVTDKESALVQVMAWYRPELSPYMV